MHDFEFAPVDPKVWMGRYRWEMCQESAYHLNVSEIIKIRLRDNAYDFEWSAIEFWRERKEKNSKEIPPPQDLDLIEPLRETRLNGAVRFIVNHYGLVLTKKPLSRDQWQAIFV